MRGDRRWRWLVATVAMLAVLAVAGCGGDDEGDGGGGGGGEAAQEQPTRTFEQGTTMARLQERGQITIGVKFDVPPFGFKNPQTDEVEGFDVDLGRYIAQQLGVEPRFIEAVSDNRIPFLQDGTADLILSTMTITAERDQEINFSVPYYVAQGRILVPGDSEIQGLDDLAGQSVCTALGSTYEDTLREQAPEAELRLVDTYSECLELVQNGAVDAVSTDDVILTGMIIQDDSLKLVGEEITTEPYGAGLREGDSDFQAFVSDAVEQWKRSGWQQAYQKWVGQYTGEEQQPPTMTLEEALELN